MAMKQNTSNKHHAPLIGITTNGKRENTVSSTHYDEFYASPTPYINAVRRAGGIAILMPPGEDQWQALADAMDGIIFAGGADIDPHHYQGNHQHPELTVLDAERDSTELAMARYLLTQNKPVLAICRGMQLVNIASGGTLHPHIMDFLTEDIHRKADDWQQHAIHVEAHSALARIMRASRVTTYSGHHQGIDQLGANLHVVATAPDGIIEAVESTRYIGLTAVQWHPEKSAANDPTQQALFDDLVNKARVQKNTLSASSAL